MTPTEAHTLTHYTEIAEAKQRDVRRIQAESARHMLKGILAAVRNSFRASQRRNDAQASERA